jgi:hypothetical protein
MDKIKEFFKNIYGYAIVVFGIIIAILAWFINTKNKEIEAMEAKIALAKTQKEADLIEVEIKERMDKLEDSNKEKLELQKTLDILEQKRQNLKDDRTEQEKSDTWNK